MIIIKYNVRLPSITVFRFSLRKWNFSPPAIWPDFFLVHNFLLYPPPPRAALISLRITFILRLCSPLSFFIGIFPLPLISFSYLSPKWQHMITSPHEGRKEGYFPAFSAIEHKISTWGKLFQTPGEICARIFFRVDNKKLPVLVNGRRLDIPTGQQTYRAVKFKLILLVTNYQKTKKVIEFNKDFLFQHILNYIILYWGKDDFL